MCLCVLFARYCVLFYGVFCSWCLCVFDVVVPFRCNLMCGAARCECVCAFVCVFVCLLHCFAYVCGGCEVVGDVVWYAFGCVCLRCLGVFLCACCSWCIV